MGRGMRLINSVCRGAAAPGRWRFQRIGGALIALTVPCGHLAFAAPGRSDTQALQRAIASIREQLRRIGRITVHAKYTDWGRIHGEDSHKLVWVGRHHPIQSAKVVATMDGLPDGLFYADVLSASFMLGTAANTPEFHERFRVAYNGRVGTFLRTWEAMPPNKLHPVNHGHVDGKMPSHRSLVDQSTGWEATIFGFTGSQLPYGYHPPFNRFIAPVQRYATVRARWVWLHGRKYLRVSRYGAPLGRDVFLLDPRAGFSIARADHYGYAAKILPTGRVILSPGRRLMGRASIHGFWRTRLGVYYPKEVIGANLAPKAAKPLAGHTGIEYRYVILVTAVAVHRRPKPHSFYVVQFPQGALIQDTQTKQYIRIGGTPSEQRAQIDRAVKLARRSQSLPSAKGESK